MERKLTIIGAGSTGHCAAAYFTLDGCEVTLCDTTRFLPAFNAIQKNGGILLNGVSGKNGLAMPHKLTTDFQEALDGATHIFICVPAERHEEIAALCAPHGVPGQNYAIAPGNLGSVLFRREFERLGTAKGVTFSEFAGNLFPCRLTGPAECLIAVPFPPKKLVAFPACETEAAIKAFEPIMKLSPISSIFEAALNSHNVILHMSMSVLNAVQIEKMGKDFAIFRDGATDGTVICARSVEEERDAVMKLFGYQVFGSATEHLSRVKQYDQFPDLDLFRSLDGPDSLHHRYIVEDGLAGGALMVSISKEYNLAAPTSEAFLHIGGLLCGIDFMQAGRTLKNLGMASLSLEDLKDVLEHGFR